MSGLVEINKIIVWAVSMEFIDLATLLNGEQNLPDFLNKCIKKDIAFISERDNQLVIQNEKLKAELTDPDRQARKEKIEIIQNQRDGISARVKFYKETLEDLKK